MTEKRSELEAAHNAFDQERRFLNKVWEDAFRVEL
jgi:hypothetical protein